MLPGCSPGLPAKRANTAHDLDELTLIGALDREASALGVANVEHVLARLDRPRTEYKTVQRRIREARRRLRD
jgi:hypothetical protein